MTGHDFLSFNHLIFYYTSFLFVIMIFEKIIIKSKTIQYSFIINMSS